MAPRYIKINNTNPGHGSVYYDIFCLCLLLLDPDPVDPQHMVLILDGNLEVHKYSSVK